MSLIGALAKATKAGETAKKTAPFYSAVDEALANLKRNKGTGAEFYTELTKQAGVKKAELADRKLEQAFKAKGKMTKEEAQQVLKDNPPPKLQERVREELTDKERQEMIDDNMERYDYRRYNDVPSSRMQEWHDEIDAEDVQHAAHRLPGGSNYREILLKLPKEFSDVESRRMMSLEANLRRGELPESQMQELLALQAKKQKAQEPYYSSHYTNDPNLLAHMRVIDRKGPNGEKILHVEEIQSDWHQEGRKKGYNKQDPVADEYQELEKKIFGGSGKYTPEEEKRFYDLQEQGYEGKTSSGVPDAPFKKNWHELAMKRLLNYAADNGYDSIAITPGSEQAKRWKNEALKVHYDQKIPQFLNEFGRPYGVEMGQMPFDAGGYKVNRDSYPLPYRVELQNSPDIVSRHATPEEAWAEAERLGSIPLHQFKITPEMRQQIQQKGLPLYQQVGIPTAGAGAASQMLEPEEEAGLAGGGSIAKMAALAKLAKMREEMTPRAEAVKALIARDENKYLRDVAPNSLTNAEIEAEIARMRAKAEASQPEVKKADGGAINYNTVPDMTDGERIIQGAPFKRGGKVKMTTNRDTMFLELSNKKLKRK